MSDVDHQDNMLTHMMMMQKALNDKIFAKEPVCLNPKTGRAITTDDIASEFMSGCFQATDLPAEWISRYCWAINDELRELCDLIPKKWWSVARIGEQKYLNMVREDVAENIVIKRQLPVPLPDGTALDVIKYHERHAVTDAGSRKIVDDFNAGVDEEFQKVVTEQVRKEAIDCLHFLMNLFLILGMSAQDVYDAYRSKNKVNHARQDSGEYNEATKTALEADGNVRSAERDNLEG